MQIKIRKNNLFKYENFFKLMDILRNNKELKKCEIKGSFLGKCGNND